MSVPPDRSREIYARTIIALAPDAEEIVFIGGWAHALHLARVASFHRPVMTTDIDVTLPVHLPPGERRSFLDCIADAGFVPDPFGGDGESMAFAHEAPDAAEVTLDLIAAFDDPRTPVPIAGQDGLVVHGYPSQRILLAHTMRITVDASFHPLLDPPRSIRVPTPGAYALVKGLSSRSRYENSRGPRRNVKYAKDIVYLLTMMNEPALATQVYTELAPLAAAYPEDYTAWRAWLTTVLRDTTMLADVADQYSEAAGRPRATVDPTLGIRDRLGAILRDSPRTAP